MLDVIDTSTEQPLVKRRVGRPYKEPIKGVTEELMHAAYCEKRRQYNRDHRDTIYKYVKKDKNQCAYIGPIAGRCTHTTFKEYCCYHKDGKLCTRPRHK